MNALWSFRPLFRPHAARMAWAMLLSLLTLAAGVALLGVSGWFLTATAVAGAALAFNPFGPTLLIRGAALVRILARYAERLVGHDATLRLLSDLRGWLFGTLFPRVPNADRDLRHGDVVSRLTADVDALDTVFLVAIGPVLTALLLGAAVTVGLVVLLPAASLFYAGAIGLAALGVPAALVVLSRKLGIQVVEASAALRIAVLDGIDGHMDLIAFGETAKAREDFSRAAARLAACRRRLALIGTLAAGLVQALAGAALIAVLWFGLAAYQAGAIGGPLLVGLLLATIASFEATGAMVRSIAKLGTAVAAAERLQGLAQRAPTIVDPVRPDALPAGGSFAFQGVTYGHDPRRPILRDFSLQVGEGSRVALIGPSGSGKSTLLSLLLRLHDTQAGSVTVAGTDIRAAAQRDLHARVALLSQETPVFLGTIRDNLLIGRGDAGEADLWRALEAARLADFVRALPDGLDAFVGETGRTLSAGQARRLGLARTLLSPAAILAFDEPTAGLDRETELAFLNDLGPATAGRTVILATHAALPPGVVDQVVRIG